MVAVGFCDGVVFGTVQNVSVYGNKLHIIDGIHITGHYTRTHTSLGALVLGRWSITVAVLEAEARVLPASIVATPDTLDVASTLELTLYTVDELALPQPHTPFQQLVGRFNEMGTHPAACWRYFEHLLPFQIAVGGSVHEEGRLQWGEVLQAGLP